MSKDNMGQMTARKEGLCSVDASPTVPVVNTASYMSGIVISTSILVRSWRSQGSRVGQRGHWSRTPLSYLAKMEVIKAEMTTSPSPPTDKGNWMVGDLGRKLSKEVLSGKTERKIVVVEPPYIFKEGLWKSVGGY